MPTEIGTAFNEIFVTALNKLAELPRGDYNVGKGNLLICQTELMNPKIPMMT